MLPNIFSNRTLKKKVQYRNHIVIELQDLLTQSLQQRLSFFSKKFLSEVWHELVSCRIQNNLVEINPDLLPFREHSFDLICSAGPLMFTNDIPGVLKQWYQALKHGGVFMASFVGENSLMELKNSFFKVEESNGFPHYLHFFPTVATRDAGMLMQRAGFSLPTADRSSYVFKVNTLLELLNILKIMGGKDVLVNASNLRMTKKVLKEVEEEYFKQYSQNGQLIVSVDIVCMTGLRGI